MVTLASPAVAEMMADVGFDWLFVDGEHGALEPRDIEGILQAAGNRAACLVRVPASEETPIKKALDLGAAGVIVPQVNTAAQAAQVVDFCRYPPAGRRGVGLARAHGYGLWFGDYIADANAQVSVVVQAEHIHAVENIGQIVEVEGIDAVLVGPYDLSASMGRMGQIDHPAVIEAIDHVTKTCQAANVRLGIFGTSAAAIRPYAAKGYTLLVAGVDMLMLGQTAQGLLSEMRGPRASDPRATIE
jgi:2-keto-3-deoxy-L-rhamnonate aldolase RhmA